MSCCRQDKETKPEAAGQTGASAPMGPPMMMRQMMARCAEMMGAMHRPGAVPPALDQAFNAWLRQMEDKAIAAVAEGEKDTEALAASLGVDEESAGYLLGRLASAGKVALFARPAA